MNIELLEEQVCRICRTSVNLLRCSKCKSVYYCSADHQQLDWTNHRRQCKKICKNKEHLTKQQQMNLQQQNQWPQQKFNQLVNGDIGKSKELNCDDEVSEGGETSNNLIANKFSSKQEEFLSLNDQRIIKSTSLTTITTNATANKNNEQNNINIVDERCLSLDMCNSSEKRYEDLCKNIINDMNTYGLSVVDDFLGLEKGLQILNEVHKMYAGGGFKDGQLVSNTLAEKDSRTIRGDKITWVKGTESSCSNIGYLINQIDAVICRAGSMKNNGLLGQYKIRERTKGMIAVYPSEGSHYITHVDNPNKDGRVITAIYYLNINWDAKRSGGLLRIFPENGSSIADIEPKFDRLIFFWSDRRNPHEVQPAHRTRYAITVWYFDANEREAALNRHRPIRNTNKCT